MWTGRNITGHDDQIGRAHVRLGQHGIEARKDPMGVTQDCYTFSHATHYVTRAHIGYLFHCLMTGARPGFGRGARAVALTSAAHVRRVALTWPAQSRASPQSGERLKRGLLCSK